MSDQEDVEVDGGEEEASTSRRSSRRTRGDKGGRLAALEKLRNARKDGGKNKYEVKELENVYDVVDEDTYSKKVNDRLHDDWIVDDGTGYCETGHELFDDDLLDDGGYGGSSSKRKSKNSKKDNQQKKAASKEERENIKSNFLSVRDMLNNMPAKRKREHEEGDSSANAGGGDDDLDEMLMELNEEKKKKVKPDERTGVKLLSVLTNANMKIKRRKDGESSVASGVAEFRSMQDDWNVDDLAGYCETKRELCDDGLLDDGFVNSSTRKCKTPKKDNEVIKADSKKKEERENIKSNFLSVTPVRDMSRNMPVKGKMDHEGGDSFANAGNGDDDFLGEVQMEVTEQKKVKEDERTGVELLSVLTNANMKIKDEVESSAIREVAELRSMHALNFFWFDIYEEPRNPGVLYLFGKISQQGVIGGHVSCCIVIKNVERCIYILPRETMRDDVKEEVTFPHVQAEFENIAPKYKIHEFKSRKVEKKYCFGEANVPRLSEYMEVCYAGTLPALPEDLQGNTFSRVFGTHSSMLENFLLKKMFKGPSWLEVGNPVQVDPAQQQSWCKMEFSCEVGNIKTHPKKDSLSIPPFVVASLNVSSVNDAASKKDTIISTSVAINRTFKIQSSVTTEGLFHDSFCLLNKPPGEVWPFDVDRVLPKGTTKMDSERSMLACLLAKLSQFDPDVYVGHDLNLDLLLLQMWNHKVPHWSRIGRLKRSSQPQKGGKMPDSRSAVAGRLVCDVKISAMELIRARSYDIASLASQVLGLKEDQISSYTGAELRQLFESSDGIQHLAAWGMSLSILNLRLMNELQVMPLALQITTIAGNALARTLMGGRSERNEFLLLHAFYNKGYIVPDKQYGKKFQRDDDDDEHVGIEGKGKKGKSGGPSYLGGLVLEPKKGFYDNFIVLMDFLSLYPSIIQEYNICFTTSTTEENTDNNERGILPEEIRKLVESRREVKKLMNENVSQELKKQYDIRQKALKLTANSMYGCLGFRNSRFYAKNLASLITGKGREILMKTKDAVEKMGFEVIYGDTDSLMINTNTQEIQKVYQIGNKIRIEINRMHKLLELEIDGVFRFLLLLKKKKYAAMTYRLKANGDAETTMELKGLDIVRRDWAPVAAVTARSILDEIMTEQALDDKIFKIVKILNDKAAELRAGTVPVKELLITKQLAKNPEEYKSRQGLYHVEVAARMNASGKLTRKFKNGDTVPYLFCTDGKAHHPVELMESQSKGRIEAAKTVNEKAADSASSSSTIKQETVLETDASYYLAQQVHPVVSRICEPIPGLDGARIAEALGMDPSSYKKRRVVEHNHEDMSLGEISEAEKYRDCPKFKYVCPHAECRREIIVESPIIEVNGEFKVVSLSKCLGCSSSLSISHVCNSLVLFMRKFIEKYYQGWFMCEDPSCDNRTRGLNLRLERGYMICPCNQGVVMVREYTDADLHKQFNCLLYSFDVAKRLEDVSSAGKQKLDTSAAESEFGRLSALVNKQLVRSAYTEIRLQDLFAELIPNPKSSFKFHDNKRGKESEPGSSVITTAA